MDAQRTWMVYSDVRRRRHAVADMVAVYFIRDVDMTPFQAGPAAEVGSTETR